MKAHRKDIPGGIDYLLVMQYRTQLIVKSFLSTYQYVEKYPLVQVPMLYQPNLNLNKYQEVAFNDSVYYLIKDGVSISIMRLQFIKNRKEFIYTIHEIKSSDVYAFQKINEYFYFIDNNKEVNRF